MMTDEEYREYLDALARRHLRPGWHLHFAPVSSAAQLTYDIERLSSTARFVRLVADRPDNTTLLKELAKELAQEGNNSNVERIFNAMEGSGVLPALDEAPEITFPNLRRSAIPEEDAHLLRHAGVEDADAEVTILIHYARTHVGGPNSSPSSIAQLAGAELKRAAILVEQLAAQPEAQPAPKKRKLFNGIGKILAGTVTAAGNLLLATGTLIAPNPATAYGVIGSSALAIGGVFQGIGDLRGE